MTDSEAPSLFRRVLAAVLRWPAENPETMTVLAEIAWQLMQSWPPC